MSMYVNVSKGTTLMSSYDDAALLARFRQADLTDEAGREHLASLATCCRAAGLSLLARLRTWLPALAPGIARAPSVVTTPTCC